MIRCAIFDLDGTLIDSVPVFRSAYVQASFLSTGRILTDNELTRALGANEEGVFQQIVGHNAEHALKVFREAEKRNRLDVTVIPGALMGLRELRHRGMILALVTGRSETSAKELLEFFELSVFFEAMRFGSPLGDVKAKNISSVLQELGVAPDEAVYVGDTKSDFLAAQVSGVLPVAASWTSSAEPADLVVTARSFSAFGEFVSWLASLEKKIG
jgi:phosphoglycolate phosphatase-like HAD superfamily hydrolase